MCGCVYLYICIWVPRLTADALSTSARAVCVCVYVCVCVCVYVHTAGHWLLRISVRAARFRALSGRAISWWWSTSCCTTSCASCSCSTSSSVRMHGKHVSSHTRVCVFVCVCPVYVLNVYALMCNIIIGAPIICDRTVSLYTLTPWDPSLIFNKTQPLNQKILRSSLSILNLYPLSPSDP